MIMLHSSAVAGDNSDNPAEIDKTLSCEVHLPTKTTLVFAHWIGTFRLARSVSWRIKRS